MCCINDFETVRKVRHVLEEENGIYGVWKTPYTHEAVALIPANAQVAVSVAKRVG